MSSEPPAGDPVSAEEVWRELQGLLEAHGFGLLSDGSRTRIVGPPETIDPLRPMTVAVAPGFLGVRCELPVEISPHRSEDVLHACAWMSGGGRVAVTVGENGKASLEATAWLGRDWGEHSHRLIAHAIGVVLGTAPRFEVALREIAAGTDAARALSEHTDLPVPWSSLGAAGSRWYPPPIDLGIERLDRRERAVGLTEPEVESLLLFVEATALQAEERKLAAIGLVDACPGPVLVHADGTIECYGCGTPNRSPHLRSITVSCNDELQLGRTHHACDRCRKPGLEPVAGDPAVVETNPDTVDDSVERLTAETLEQIVSTASARHDVLVDPRPAVCTAIREAGWQAGPIGEHSIRLAGGTIDNLARIVTELTVLPGHLLVRSTLPTVIPLDKRREAVLLCSLLNTLDLPGIVTIDETGAPSVKLKLLLFDDEDAARALTQFAVRATRFTSDAVGAFCRLTVGIGIDQIVPESVPRPWSNTAARYGTTIVGAGAVDGQQLFTDPSDRRPLCLGPLLFHEDGAIECYGCSEPSAHRHESVTAAPCAGARSLGSGHRCGRCATVGAPMLLLRPPAA